MCLNFFFFFAGLWELWETAALWKLRDKEAVTEGVWCVVPYKKLVPVLYCPCNFDVCVFCARQLLGELLLDRHNFTVMTRYISKPENLKLMMNLLRDKSPNIQFEAFHVFKVTSWLDWKVCVWERVIPLSIMSTLPCTEERTKHTFASFIKTVLMGFLYRFSKHWHNTVKFLILNKYLFIERLTEISFG